MIGLESSWQYFHNHWQDNVIAGFIYTAIAGPVAWFWKIKPMHHDIKHVHARLDEHKASLDMLHKKLNNTGNEGGR